MYRTDEILDELEQERPAYVGERFLRFMGNDEFTSFLIGSTVVNDRNHARFSETNSHGFCFLRVGDRWTEYGSSANEQDAIEEAYSFLSGIVSDDVALVVENESAALQKGYGIYADPYGDWYDRIHVNEFSVDMYDRTTMRPVRAYLWPGSREMEVIEF